MAARLDPHRMVYKIVSEQHWRAFQREGQLPIEGDDLRDGYIHLSSPDQVRRTAAKFFAGRTGLVLLAISPEALGQRLRWERSASGAVYPHLYGALDHSSVVSATPIELDPGGHHILPPEFT